ncbi:MAG: hypothetical protein ISR96_05815 [Nitrospira sp.]|nr:hypothetical protein [bacterium]MBL7049013.1 hypothetical protein [Nitrospira sp.]
MDPNRKAELRNIYKDLFDEQLIEIARNDEGEYESAAVETALAELSGRGITDIDSDEESSATVQDDLRLDMPMGLVDRERLAISGPSIEIARFAASETADIERIFLDHDIPFEIYGADGASGAGCSQEFVFHVAEAAFVSAISLLKQYFGLGSEGAGQVFSGQCPACGAEVINAQECTDCGLALIGQHSCGCGGSCSEHPFETFLKQNGLL